MPGDWNSTYRFICQMTGFDPESSAYKTQIMAYWNSATRDLFGRHPWNFAMRLATVNVNPDYTTGTCTFTSGSNELTGSGTAWTQKMEGAYIHTGLTSLNPTGWRRIGRYSSATSMYLEEDWPSPTVAASTHTIRQLYVAMPKDCKKYQLLTDEHTDKGMLYYQAPAAVDRRYLDPDVTGTPRWFTDAPDLNPRTPERALTATLAAGGSLTSGRTYIYKYTWFVGDIETGCSPTVSATPSGGNLTVALSGFQEISPLSDGRIAYLYRAESDVGIFYRLAQVSSAGGTLTDDGTTYTPDRANPYVDGNRVQMIRVYPRLGTGDSTVTHTIRYWAFPREVQKDSDYFEMPQDAEEAVKAMVIANILRSVGGSSGQAEHWERVATERIRVLEKHELSQKPNEIVRGAFGHARSGWILGDSVTMTVN